MERKKIIIVGGGLAGLMSALQIADDDIDIEIISQVTVKRSNSVCAQGGINAALNTKGEDDSVWEHFYDTIYAGDFLANQTPVKNLTETAPKIISMMDNFGVPFSRASDGKIDLRNFGGVKKKRTAFAGSTTGQQLLYALDQQVRKLETEGKVTKYEGYEFLQIILDDNSVCRGCIAQNIESMQIEAFPADAVILATGGAGVIYGKSTNSITNTGSAASIVYQQGAGYANAEFIQIHPTAMLGDDKTRLMSESARGVGGRIWTYKDEKPWYFLEEWYPTYKNLVPRDIASRAIYNVCTEMGLGIDGKNQVYLDVSHLPDDFLDEQLGGILEIYETFYGDDPRKVPMKIFPAIHYFMGGIHTDFNHMTKIPGLFAAGECDYMYHGANRLGANSLLSAIYSGMVAGPAAKTYIKEKIVHIDDKQLESCIANALAAQMQDYIVLLNMSGHENPYSLHEELGKLMTESVGIVRYNDKLAQADKELSVFLERFENIGINDNSQQLNQTILFTRRLRNMMHLAKVIIVSALTRDESRGAHYKPEFPNRNDEKYLKTTVAFCTKDGPEITFEDVDTSHIEPSAREYEI